MKVERIDHIHIAVRDLEKAIKFFEKVLGTTFSPPLPPRQHDDQGNDVGAQAALAPLGLELIAPAPEHGAFGQFLDKSGEGLKAISFKVDDLEAAIEHCQDCGLRLLRRISHGSVKEAQFHPKDSYGFIIELCEYPEQSAVYVATQRER